MRTIVFALFIAASLSLTAATVGGIFSCDGSPVPTIRVVIAINAADSSQLGSMQTDAAGAYSFEIADGTTVMLIGFASRGRQLNGYTLHEYTPDVRLVPSVSGSVTVNLLTRPARHFIFEGKKGGSLALTGSFPNMFAFNEEDRAFPTFSIGAEKAGRTGQVPSYNIPVGPAGATASFFVEWDLPEAGRIMVRLDNGGKGYPVEEQGGLILDLNREAAYSALRRLEVLVHDGRPHHPDAESDLATVQQLFDAEDYDAAAGRAIVAAERTAVYRSQVDIELYRKGTLKVSVTDAKGRPLPGATVQVTQQSRQFLFGALPNIPNGGNEFMQTLRDDGFNFATAGILWKDIEPTDDAYSWYTPDSWFGIPLLDGMGYALTGHSLVYFLDHIMPDYLLTLEGTALLDEVTEHTGVVVNHYKDVMDEWILINEAHGYPASRGLSREEITAVTQEVANAVAAIASGVPTMVNAAPDWFGQSIVTELLIPDRGEFFTLPVKRYFQDLAGQVSFDRIGQQMYNGGCVTLFHDHGMGDVGMMPVYDLAELRRQILSLAELGRPIHLSELSIPSAMNAACSGMGYWHASWDEMVQADYLEAFYTMIFGLEPIISITYWDLLDKDAFVNSGGLFRDDLTPKPAYERIKNLLAQWRTETTLKTDDTGHAEVIAFGGEHLITATYKGKSASVLAPLKEQGSFAAKVIIEEIAPPDDIMPDDDVADVALSDDTAEGGCGCSLVL